MKLAFVAVLLALAPMPAVEAFEEEALVEGSRASKPPARVASKLVPPPPPAAPAPRPLRNADEAPTIASGVEIVPRVCSRPPPAR